MDIDALKQKIGKFMTILSSIRQKLPDITTFCSYFIPISIGLIFFGLFFAAGWNEVHSVDGSFVTFDYGNGKQTTLFLDSRDKISLIQSQLRDEMNLSSKYTADLFVGNYKLDQEKNLRYYKLIKFGSNEVSPIPLVHVRFSCPECPESEKVTIDPDLFNDVNSKLLSRIDAIEKLLMKYIQINEDKPIRGN